MEITTIKEKYENTQQIVLNIIQRNKKIFFLLKANFFLRNQPFQH